MDIEGVMVSYDYSGPEGEANIITVAASGIKFSDRWVLTHGSILSPLKIAKDIFKAKGKIIHNDQIYDTLPEIYITCERPKVLKTGDSDVNEYYDELEDASKRRSDGKNGSVHGSYQVRVMTGRIRHMWQCSLLDRCVDDILYSWTIGHRDGDIEKQSELGKVLLSVLILVDLAPDIKESGPIRPLSALLDAVEVPPGRGAILNLHSTPFGCEVFLNSLTTGTVCGVVGRQPCLLLTDAATALGSEGGPAFITVNGKSILVGMVVCSVSWWRGEWVGLTLIAPLATVLSTKLRIADKFAPTVGPSVETSLADSILSTIDASVVLVRCGSMWGSGIYLGDGYFVTCSHVVCRYEPTKVSIFCGGEQQIAIVKYRTPRQKAYDLALIYSNPEYWTQLVKCTFATSHAVKGETIIAIGYPYFNERNFKSLKPMITRGQVNNISPSMLQTSCCVQSGFSGGPICRLTRTSSSSMVTCEVLGVIVCNAKTQKSACYPYINMAIPVHAFRTVLLQYMKTKGMEIYSDFCGQCVPMLATIRKIKMEIGTEIISMAKACADEIEPLKRFKCKSEPAYLFISKGMVTRVMFGADGIRLNEIVIEELALEEKEKSSNFKRPRFEFSDRTREEEEHTILEAEHQKLVLAKRKRIAEARQASRKRRVCERLAMGAPILNFIIFFPHCHQAHYDLYEKWDPLNLTVFGKEEVQLTEETIAEAFYQSDVDLNEACVHELLGGPVLVILFKAMETDTRDLVKLMRHVLYEEIQEVDPEQPSDEQSQMTAYQMYGITSKTREEVLHERWEQQQELKKNQREERKRLREESKRLAQEAEEERILMEKKRAEEERIARLQAGAAGGAASGPEADPEPESAPAQGEQGEEGEAAIEEENPEDVPGVEYGGSDQESEEFYYEKENDEDEYIPPGNLYIPGFYSPPNHLARANGIALFFPKLTEKFSDIESEFLPPHILMLYPIDKRHEIQETIIDFKDEVLQVGIFTGIPPEKPEFVAYSVKQYDKMHTLPDPNECMALMVSRKRSLPLLTLAGLGPIHISMDVAHGELECAELFPVGYGDDFEEEETIVEEEEIE